MCLRQLDMSSVSEQSITSQLHNIKILYNNSINTNQIIRETTEIHPHATLMGRWPCRGYRQIDSVRVEGASPWWEAAPEGNSTMSGNVWETNTSTISPFPGISTTSQLHVPSLYFLSLQAHKIPASISSFSTSHLTIGQFPLFLCLFHLQPCLVVSPFPLSFHPRSPCGHSSWTSMPWISRKPAPPKLV